MNINLHCTDCGEDYNWIKFQMASNPPKCPNCGSQHYLVNPSDSMLKEKKSNA